jgi:hypothetical protein
MRRHTLFLLLTLLACNAVSQITGKFKEMFLEAESYFLFEEYIEALPYYVPILKQYPDNDNINYKIGVCYLHHPYEKSESIQYLEAASENISLKYKENSFKETSAPPETYFYLGNAYRINGQLDRAIETYNLFKAQADPELYDLDLVEQQINACENAKELQTRPVDYDIMNLGDRINTRHSDVHPVISGDETKIVYIQKQAFFDALAFCEKMEEGWSFPRILMQEMAVDEDAYPTALNYEGDELIIYRSDNFIGDLFTSRLVDGFWTPPVRMNDNINTKYWESHACFTRSGDTLFFTSNRKGSIGGLDIYYSVRGEKGEWGIPTNLGPTINTRYNEETPFITEDGKTLFFSSYGHYNMGGYDVFYSTKLEDGEWSVPVNAGYPINTTDDDVFFHPVRNGKFAYFPRMLDGGFGLSDIYLYKIYSETHPRKFQVSGILDITNLARLSNPVRIAVINQHTKDTLIVYADLETGEFTFEASSWEYELLVEGQDIETTSSAFTIPDDYRDKGFALKPAILLTQAAHLLDITIQNDIKIKDTLIFVETDDTLEIDLTLERKANLYLDIIQEGQLVSQDSFPIDRQHFTYLYVPVPGDNLLKFKLIDRRRNHSYKDVHVIYTPKDEVTDMTDTQVLEQNAQMEDPIILLLDYLEKEDLREIIKLLIETSAGELQNLLQSFDAEQNNISKLEDLYNYLIQRVRFYDYTEEDVISLFLNLLKIIEHEPIVEEMHPLRETEKDQKGGKGWIFFVFGGLALILLIFLFVRRKDRDKKDETV